MKKRCEDPKNQSFARYGGRGISVCERWQKFENFLEDMGLRPKGTSINRRNNDGNYEPENCEWATNEVQQNNRSDNHTLTLNGRTQTMAMWARETGLAWTTIKARINQLGWPVEKALTQGVWSYRNHKSVLE